MAQTRRAHVLLAACLGLAAAWLHPAARAGEPADACSQSLETLMERVNQARAAGAVCGARGRLEGSGTLQWNDTLRDMALMQAQFLSDIEDLRHAGPNGQTIADRARAAGYRYSRVAENLALGARSVEHVLRAWTSSESHCVNLYDPRFTEMALVCTSGKGGRPLWVMVLGRPKPPP